MKKKLIYTLLGITALLSYSCQEEIIIDTEEGESKIGIYGGLTTDEKEHTITISRTAPFYAQEDIEMISGAKVLILDQTSGDTLRLEEKEPGIYHTQPTAGVVGHTYHLEVEVPEKGQLMHYQSESAINPFSNNIDSIQVFVQTFFDIVSEDVFKICPYFQTSKENLYYLFDMEINGVAYTDTLTKKAKLHLGQLSGLYYNGKEMSMIYKDLNVYPLGLFTLDQTIEREIIHVGDTIGITVNSVPKGYYQYIGDISGSIGSNPLMGSPTNVRTNIVGKEKEAVGYFYAASSIHFKQVITSLPRQD